MRLLSSLCKHCTRDNKTCPHYQLIRSRISTEGKTTLTYHCQEYYEIIPLNTDVEVELHEMESGTTYSDESPAEPYGEWVSIGWVKGVVIGPGRRGFIMVKLNKPVTLVLPNRDNRNDWVGAEARTVTHWSKRLKDIKVIGEDNG